jgi:SAM-dependent methyltransferase
VGVDELTNQENRHRQIEDLFSTIAMDADEVTKQEILAASQNWLALLDAGDFVECCNQAGHPFKSNITPEQFEALTDNFIAAHGKMTSRVLKGMKYADERPRQRPVQVMYETRLEFEEKPVLEAVLMFNGDGRWKVCGYNFQLIDPPYYTFPPPEAGSQQYRESTYGDCIADVYDHWYWGETPEAIARLSELAGAGPALELGVGTGRVALPLASRGVKVHGIDASEAMAAKLAGKPGGDRIPVTIGNFADVEVSGEYSLIYVVFNTFFMLSDQEEQVRCFANVAKRLRRGGVFLVEAFVPDPARFKDDQTVRVSDMKVGSVNLETSIHDRLTQRVMSHHILIGQSGVKIYPIQIRYAWPAELDLMARLAGMRLRERWADWRRSPFVAESTNHVSIYDLP